MSFYDDASLIMIPSGYKAGKLYSAKPTDGSGDLSFTRTGSTATRVNSAGLIEECRTNLVTYSEQFDNAAWTKDKLGVSSLMPAITANYAASPIGTLTADRIVLVRDSGSNTYSAVFQSISGVQIGSEYSFSVWLKSLSGTPTIVIANNGTSYQNTATLTSEWVRYSITTTATATTIQAQLSVVGTSFATGISENADFLAWGFQVELGVATAYIATTSAAVTIGPIANVPRLDYTGGGCPKLLMEPTRTNLLKYSEAFNNAYWVKSAATITANTSVSPDGYTNADKLIENNQTNGHSLNSDFILVTAGNQYTLSIFAKKSERNFILIFDSYINTGYYFNLNTGVIGSKYGSGSVTPKIENYGNGWYRCSLTYTAHSGGYSLFFANICKQDNEVSYLGDGSSSILIYGAQLEAGSYATSYIPTWNASVTRNADSASKTGISSLIGQTEGTIYAHVKYIGLDSSGTAPVLLSNSSTSNQVYFLFSSNGKINADFYFNNSFSARIETTSNFLTLNSEYKMAMAYKENDFVFYINGVQIGFDNVGIVNVLENLRIGEAPIPGYSNVAINKVLLFKTRLSNSDLANITTL